MSSIFRPFLSYFLPLKVCSFPMSAFGTSMSFTIQLTCLLYNRFSYLPAQFVRFNHFWPAGEAFHNSLLLVYTTQQSLHTGHLGTPYRVKQWSFTYSLSTYSSAKYSQSISTSCPSVLLIIIYPQHPFRLMLITPNVFLFYFWFLPYFLSTKINYEIIAVFRLDMWNIIFWPF